MEDIKSNNILKPDNTFHGLDDFLCDIDLNEDIEKFIELINDDNLQSKFDKNVQLDKLRNENYYRYHKINILNYEDLPFDFFDKTEEILRLYKFIDSKLILTDNLLDANNIKQLLNNIYIRKDRLDNLIKSTLKQKTKENDENQAKFSLNYFESLNVSEEKRKKLIEKYNNLILFNSNIPKDMYEDIKIQYKREELITDIFELLNIETHKKINLDKKDKIQEINEKINLEITKYKEQIQYLEDIIPENSKHIKEFEEFKEFCNKLIAYDDTSYDNAKQTYEVLSDDLKFKTYISNFEEKFIQEIIDKQNEESFIYEKVGIKNLKKSLDYIASNYMDKLDDESKKEIEEIFKKINQENYDLEEVNNKLGKIVKNIWRDAITDVYNFNPNEDYSFICSNNQFIDEKYQTILITKKEINRVDDYEDYQIGFICGYNNNIMYITENDDIMSVSDIDDMSNLKTPIQLEQEFINFKVCNRIALNGFMTKIEGVYYIDDGNIDKYLKAVELANMYKLPLILLRKEKTH